jgi:hypothetical protein
VVVDAKQPSEDDLVVALGDLAHLDGGERLLAFRVVPQHAGDGVGGESFPDDECRQLGVQVRRDDAPEVEDEPAVVHAVQIRRRR